MTLKRLTPKRQRLVERNYALARWAASHYEGRGVDLEDLVGIATLNLVRAARTYDPAQGTFACYATEAMRRELYRAVQHKGLIRIPQHIKKAVAQYRRFKYWHPKGTLEEFADAFGLSSAVCDHINTDIKSALESIADLNELDDTILEKADDRYDTRDAVDNRDELRAIMFTLNDRDRTVIKMRFGINGSDPLTFREIAGHLKLTPVRVQQIMRKILAKMQDRARLLGLTG